MAGGACLHRVLACLPAAAGRCRTLHRWVLPRQHWAQHLPAAAWRLAALHVARAEAAAACVQQRRLHAGGGGAEGALSAWAQGRADAGA